MPSTKKQRERLAQELLENFYVLNQKMAVRNGPPRAGGDITHSQWVVLMLIESEGEITIKDIRTKLGVSSQAVTQMVNSLAQKGLVKRRRHSDDKRSVVLSLSKKSGELFRKCRTQALNDANGVLHVLTDAELKQLVRLYKKLVQSV